jgi:hypothetical protein
MTQRWAFGHNLGLSGRDNGTSHEACVNYSVNQTKETSSPFGAAVAWKAPTRPPSPCD